jgi:hypothetical protein
MITRISLDKELGGPLFRSRSATTAGPRPSREICLGEDLYRVDLINKAFGQGGPLADPLRGGKHNDGLRSLFAGTIGMFRNPVDYREVTYDDEAEAVEAVALADALMRHLDRFRLAWPEQAARYRRRHRHPGRIYWRSGNEEDGMAAGH